MPLKVAIAQAAAGTGTPTFTQDFTDASAGFSSDVKAAIFVGSQATANHTTTGRAALNIGVAAATGGNTQGAVSTDSDDGLVTTDSNGYGDDSFAYVNARPSTAGSDGEFSINSWLSNGVRVDWADQSESELITAVLLGGDIEARVVSTALNGTTPVTLNHGLSAAPEVIIGLTSTASDAGAPGTGRISIGFWDGTNYVSYSVASSNAAGSENLGADLSTTYILSEITTAGVLNWSASLSSVGATTFDVTASAATTDLVIFLCLRGTGAALAASAGVFDTSTSTGVATEVSGLSVAAQVLLAIPTLQTATGLDGAGDMNIGLIAAVNNSGAGTQYGGCVNSLDDGVSPTVNKSQSTNSQALRCLDAAGAADVEATIDSWGTSVALNYSNVNASAFKIPYLAFGQASASGNAPRARFYQMLRSA